MFQNPISHTFYAIIGIEQITYHVVSLVQLEFLPVAFQVNHLQAIINLYFQKETYRIKDPRHKTSLIALQYRQNPS